MGKSLSDVTPILKFGQVKADLFGGGESGSPAGVKVVDESGTAYYIFAGTSGLRVHTSLPTDDGDGNLIGTVGTGEVVTALIADANVTPAKTNIVEARTATADGLTTGIISDTTTHVTVTSADANHIITLPTPTPGRMLVINVAATGFELRSNAPTTVLINGGTGGAAVESAIPANSTIIAICITATAWKAIFLDADSDVAKVEAAA